MAWNGPARDADLPRDPRPRSAVLWNTARLALAGTFVTTALLVGAIGTTDAADSADGDTIASWSSPSPALGWQRVEVPWAGVAVSFPADWDVREGADEWPTTADRRIYTSAVPMFRQLLVADGPHRLEDGEQCEVQSFAYPELTPFDVAYSLSVLSCTPATPMPANVSLAAGEAAQLHCQQQRQDGHRLYQSWYVLSADPGYVWLWCRSRDERPQDRWLSIAQTVELLPAEE